MKPPLRRLFRAMCLLGLAIFSQSSFATLISHLTVNNSAANGGTGATYQVCPGGGSCGSTSGFVTNALQYLDRTFTINSTVPSVISGQTFILTANSDKNADAGSSSYMSFTVGQAATVYVVYCTAIPTKPAWLTSNFTDTGLSVTNSSSFTFELYSKTYASGGTVTLGSNVVTGGDMSIGMYSVIVVPTMPQSLISNLSVNNGGAFTYAICGTGGTCGATTGFVSGALQYVDSAFEVTGAVPAIVNGRSFIQTAEGDRSNSPGSSNFIGFTLGQSATVFVAHDVQVPAPAWLTSQFLDTGTSVTNNNGNPGGTFEIYSNIYPSGTNVQLGGNTQTGTTTFNMYSVAVAPTTANTVAPNTPSALSLIPNCNTAAVVGLTWTASTTNTGGLPIAGYRIARSGTIIATVPYTQTSYQDTSVLQSTAYIYSVSAFDQAGNVSLAASLNTTTMPISATGDAAYCPSTKITGMSFDFLNIDSRTHGNGGATPTSFSASDKPPYTDGSDLWSVSQALDGSTYAFFGDGWGLCGIIDTGSTMTNDETSFGFGKMTALPSSGRCPTEWSNLYGGYNSAHPYGGYTKGEFTSNGGLILGKASGVVAVGNDFYALAAAWRSGDSSNYLNMSHKLMPPKSSPNNHQEIVSSTGTGNGGAAWVDNTAWDLCNGSGTQANPVWGGALSVCPGGFVQFGPGYTGLPPSLAGYVYMYGVQTPTWFASGPGGTYLLRVAITPTVQLLNPSAYQYFAGLDVNGNPIWTTNGNQKQIVFNDLIDQKYTYKSADGTTCANLTVSMGMGLGEAVYNSTTGRFIASAEGKVGQVAFYEAPNPWGPWSVISYTNLSMSNIQNSGWGMPGTGGLGGGVCSGGKYMYADGLGIHIANGFTDSTGKVLTIIFSSNGIAPASASDLGGDAPPGNPNGFGNSMDSLNLLKATLTTN